MDLIKIVKTIEPEYKNTDQCINPLPNEVELTLDNEDYLIELNLKDDVLKTNFWQGVEQYKASDDDIDYIYNYLEQLLLNKIEETKVYYNEHNYNYQVWN
tara:strand:+ start:3876 stop:4175 length:300 start_codon:yes stop_codon:yes gene_type:complete